MKVFLEKYEKFIEEEDLISKIATFLFVNTSTNTNYGSFTTDSEEIEEVFGISKSFIRKIADKILICLEHNFKELVADSYWVEEANRIVFDITLYMIGIGGFIQDDECLEDDPCEM